MSDPAPLSDVLLEVDEILDFAAFAAQRSARLKLADADIEPYVRDDLLRDNWDDTLDAAGQLWLDIFGNLAPNAYPNKALQDFQAELEKALNKTKIGDDGPDQAQLDRIVKYVGTATVNDATYSGTYAAGGRQIRWVAMDDQHTRVTHARADGQTVAVNESFDVGGSKLRYPGDPLGPVEETINCRCYIAPVGRLARRNVMAAAAPAELEDDVDVDEEETDVDGEELVDDLVEIPWHGVLAPEEKPTGDGRMFAKDSITWRDLPMPLLYQHYTGMSHSGSTRVGRIDEVWRTEDGEIRARGAFNTSEDAQKVIEGIMDGSVRGVSVDVDDIELDFARSEPQSEDGYGGSMVFSRARISALTIVAIPAYQEAYIALGEAFEDELTDADHEALAACGCDQALELEDVEEFRDVSTKERKKLADEDKAMPDGSFPIANEEDLRNAIQAIGRAKDPDAVKRHIKKRARALGREDLIPEDWAGVTEELVAAAGTKDGPGWITNPRATARIRRYWTRGKGAAKIRWGAPGDFNRCRKQLAKYVRNPEWLAGTCANMHKEAIGLWPGMERGGRHSILTAVVPAVTLTAAAPPVPLEAEAFADPRLVGPTPLTVSTGRVYGHLATWGVCHIGIQDVCTTAPHSAHDYAYFRTGVVQTTEGPVPVGQITMRTGHAGLGQSAKAAAAHYDNTGSVVADVAAGEDAFGIWVAGVLRPGVDEQTVAELQAAALSGDWREIGGSLELVAALAVNVPGFPVPRVGLAASAQETRALVAAGVVENAGVFAASRDAAEIAAIARTAVQEYRAELAREEQQQERAARVAPIRDRVRAERLAGLREKFEVM